MEVIPISSKGWFLTLCSGVSPDSGVTTLMGSYDLMIHSCSVGNKA